MLAFLNQYTHTYPDITLKSSIGQSIEGRRIHSLEVSEDPGIPKEGKPVVGLIGNVRGDDAVGRELLLMLIKRLEEYTHRQAGRLTDRPTDGQ